MGFTEAVATCFRKYATFSGRARRAEYWWWSLFATILGAIMYLIDGRVFPSYTDIGPATAILSLALFLPGLSVTVRRLHDTGRSAWWVLILLVPLIGFFVLLYWTIRSGDPTANAYGPNPIPETTRGVNQ